MVVTRGSASVCFALGRLSGPFAAQPMKFEATFFPLEFGLRITDKRHTKKKIYQFKFFWIFYEYTSGTGEDCRGSEADLCELHPKRTQLGLGQANHHEKVLPKTRYPCSRKALKSVKLKKINELFMKGYCVAGYFVYFCSSEITK